MVQVDEQIINFAVELENICTVLYYDSRIFDIDNRRMVEGELTIEYAELEFEEVSGRSQQVNRSAQKRQDL